MVDFMINKTLLLMKIHFFLSVGGYGPFAPFVPTMARQRGYSAFIVGIIGTLQLLPGMILRPVAGALTDKYKCRRSAFIGSAAFACLSLVLLAIIPGSISKTQMADSDVLESPLFWLFFGSVAFIQTIGSVKNVLEDTVCVTLLGDQKHLYGQQRLWGSIGWSVLAFIASGCVDWYSKDLEYKNYTPGFMIGILCWFLDIIVVANIQVIQNEDEGVTVSSKVKEVLTRMKVLLFLLWVILSGFFMAYIWNFVIMYLEELSNIFHNETISWMKTLQAVALNIRCLLGEVPSFYISTFLLKHMNAMDVFSLMFLTFTIIFGVYAFVTNPLWALPVESLNGVVFAVSYSAAISHAGVLAPVGAEGTLQGIVGTCYNAIGAPTGSFVGGYLIKLFGTAKTWKIVSIMAFFTTIIQAVINNIIYHCTKNEGS